MTTPQVSVIIAAYNATATIGTQLAALKSQESAPRFEVIVVDNGSGDDLAGYLKQWRAQLDLRYVAAGQIKGASYARNVGIAHARAEQLLFCDADDVVASDWVRCGASVLANADVFTGSGANFAAEELTAGLANIWRQLDRRLPPGGRVELRPVTAWPILMGGNSGLRKQVALDIGGYDAGLRVSIEDNDLAARLQRAGYQITAASNVRIAYRRRTQPAQLWREGLASGRWHQALCSRHGLVKESPELRHGAWTLDLLRVGLAGVRMVLSSGRRDWAALLARAATALGMWQGWFLHRLLGRQPPAKIGAGLGQPALVAAYAGHAMLLLSPHLDDAWLSAYELITTARPEVWTVFAAEPDPPQATDWDKRCGYPDSAALMAQRRAEDAQAFAGSDVRVRHLEALDRAYTTGSRRRADLKLLARELLAWVEEHAADSPIVVLPAGAGSQLPPSVIDQLRSRYARAHSSADNSQQPLPGQLATGGRISYLARLKRYLKARSSDFLHWDYLRRKRRAQRRGMLANPDHLVVRDTALEVLAPKHGVEIWLYEELPYLWGQPGDVAVGQVAERLERQAVLLNTAVAQKDKWVRISAYASQLTVLDPQRRRLAQAQTLPATERCWRLLGADTRYERG